MQFTKVFKGFYESNGKKPKLKLNEIDMKVVTYEQARNFDSFVGYLAPGYVLIDIDNKLPGGEYDTNKTESKILIEILDRLGITTPILETDHGHHFFFHTTDKTILANTGVTTPIGVTVDYKTGEKNGASCFKLEGRERTLYLDCKEIAELPLFLKYNKRLEKKLEELKNGIADNGRNNFLSSYKFLLLKNGYLEKEVYRILELINDYILYEPLEHKELGIIMREENIGVDHKELERESFYIVGENGKAKLSTEKVARYTVRENNIIRIEKLLFGFNGRHYEKIQRQDIKDYILNLIPSITIGQWRETIDKVESFAPKKEATKGYTTFKNGNINFNDKKYQFTLEPHHKDIITTFLVPTDYIENIDTNFVEKYLKELVCKDDILYQNLIQYIGYLFYPNNFLQECLVIKGKNRNGKSTFLKFLVEMLGSNNISNVGLKQLTSRFGASAIVGKAFNIVDDISDEYIEISEKFKQATTGDPIEIEEKGKTPYRYPLIIKMLFTCNEIPKIKDPTGANKRRMRPLPFENCFCEERHNLDPFLLEKLITEENKSAFLKLSILGLKTLLISGGLMKSDKIEKLREEFDEENNPIKLFIKDTMYNEFKSMFQFLNKKDVKEIYASYEIWSCQNGYKALGSHSFMRQLKANIPHLIHKRYHISQYAKGYRYEFEEENVPSQKIEMELKRY